MLLFAVVILNCSLQLDSNLPLTTKLSAVCVQNVGFEVSLTVFSTFYTQSLCHLENFPAFWRNLHSPTSIIKIQGWLAGLILYPVQQNLWYLVGSSAGYLKHTGCIIEDISYTQMISVAQLTLYTCLYCYPSVFCVALFFSKQKILLYPIISRFSLIILKSFS
jgi:hypothetical protein